MCPPNYILGKSVRQQLQKCLDLRNGCGHPNSLKLAEHSVSSHIEILMLNVFSRFWNGYRGWMLEGPPSNHIWMVRLRGQAFVLELQSSDPRL